MKVRLGTLKYFIREIAMHEAHGTTNFTFEVYGPDDETYVVSAAYNSMSPYDVEIWKATDESGQEVDVDMLRTFEPDLEAKAFDWISENLYDDTDPPGTGFDDPY